VLSLVSNQPKIHIESLAGAGIPKHPELAHRPDDPISVNAEHRMERAVQNLDQQARGLWAGSDRWPVPRSAAAARVGRAADRVPGGPSSGAIELGGLGISVTSGTRNAAVTSSRG
jgi:hypothetical protein